MVLHVVSPLFTGEQPPEEVIWQRINSWEEFAKEDNDDYEELKSLCGDRVSITPYRPGKEIYLPSKRDKYAIKVTYPTSLKSIVPKGLVIRLHLLAVLYQVHSGYDKSAGVDPGSIIFACIDGSGAFEFSCLKLLVQTFAEHEDVDVVLGRRPADYSGMVKGRKEIEEFEQYLLFRHRRNELTASLFDCELDSQLLPDGQAGCWGFRLRCAPHLPLTANEYEIEFDLLSSAIESELRIAYTSPLSMPRQERFSSATKGAIGMSIKKLEFIKRKLRITDSDVAQAWLDFKTNFAGTTLVDNILPGYEEELLKAYSDQ